MSTAMVSKHVMHIEGCLGVRLLNRNSRTLSLTEPGRMYYERCKIILGDLEETELELSTLGVTARGTLRITCPSWFAGQHLASIISSFRERCPEIVVDVSFEDRLTDLVEEGFDVALRVLSDPRSLAVGLIARPVRSIPFYVGASPDYLKRHGIPQSPEDLAQHDCVAAGVQEPWELQGPKGKIEVPARVVMRCRSMTGVPQAVAAGIGLATLPEIFFQDPVFKNQLIPVLTKFPFAETTLYVVYFSRKHVSLKVRTFIDFILDSVSNQSPIQNWTLARTEIG